MKKATKREDSLIADILSESSGADSGSAKEGRRERKAWALMDYSFEISTVSDDVFLYDDNESGALIVYIPVITNFLGIIPLRLCLTIVIIL
ncbi:hypothetical protein [Chitinophaga tropicalis]|uniref:Uncharacterized protein n=1 Tax=Chitinophaga tropicalis TaxID=2683588 RepID=A0A7K1UE03_9BACT|nr:hypothetical protein [Chitinophaga tropicalis]MVT12627.1 hypothetical protein [Chitinophaga tropicalis]